MKVASGLKPGGLAVINTRKQAEQIKQEFGINGRVATVNATQIARELLGVPITNTTMIGAVVKATGVVDMESLV